MDKTKYFDNDNYTGNHLHVGNWEDEGNPIVEAIAWERQDGSMDLFFNDFVDDKEFKALFGNKDNYYDEFLGVFLVNVKTDDEAYEMFCNWVKNVLYPYRNLVK
jgi:hypothetical protein